VPSSERLSYVGQSMKIIVTNFSRVPETGGDPDIKLGPRAPDYAPCWRNLSFVD